MMAGSDGRVWRCAAAQFTNVTLFIELHLVQFDFVLPSLQLDRRRRNFVSCPVTKLCFHAKQ